MKTTVQLKKQLEAASDLLTYLSNSEDRHVMIMSNLTRSSIEEIVRELTVDTYSEIDLEDILDKTRIAIIDLLNISKHIKKIMSIDWDLISSCLDYSAHRLSSRLDGDLVFLTNCDEKCCKNLIFSKTGLHTRKTMLATFFNTTS